ncbi:MAG: hypothetical protein CL526_03105 [Aequorivita sp.]|nr:hypothetical protein [Aequorivita sp.]|tara:strand:- start:113 stop:367 length:255 start_codon:yes stop_codon:yes gene_type:complete
MKYFLNCKNAAHVCDKAQYSEAGMLSKLLLRIHIFICQRCRGYVKQNTKLTNTINAANLHTLCPKKKQSIKSKLREEIQKQQRP